jgi:drug/metabolite transporter (DMT)-like permease
VQIALGYVCLGIGVRRAPAMTTAMLLLVEPVLNPLWVWLLHGEVPGSRALAGGGVILAATAVQALAGAGPTGRGPADRGMPAPPC